MKFLTFDETRDFPYYNNNPRISKGGWLILILSVIIGYFLSGIISLFSELLGGIVFVGVILIPLLYLSDWDYSLIFKKPTKSEIILAVLMFVGYIIYALIADYGLQCIGITSTAPYSTTVTVESIVALVFSMMGEELMKFIPLMFLMRVCYRFTQNRNMSLAVAVIIVLIIFGLLHYSGEVLTVLLIQGLGSIFEMYGYIKTKNLLVPYISHLLTDMLVFITIFLGLG